MGNSNKNDFFVEENMTGRTNYRVGDLENFRMNKNSYWKFYWGRN